VAQRDDHVKRARDRDVLRREPVRLPDAANWIEIGKCFKTAGGRERTRPPPAPDTRAHSHPHARALAHSYAASAASLRPQAPPPPPPCVLSRHRPASSDAAVALPPQLPATPWRPQPPVTPCILSRRLCRRASPAPGGAPASPAPDGAPASLPAACVLRPHLLVAPRIPSLNHDAGSLLTLDDRCPSCGSSYHR
jgi:hypothetical protein